MSRFCARVSCHGDWRGRLSGKKKRSGADAVDNDDPHVSVLTFHVEERNGTERRLWTSTLSK